MLSLFNAAANVGFATIRVSYASPDQPLQDGAVGWLARDFSNAKQWAQAMGVCAGIDPARFDQAAATSGNRSLPSRDVWQVVDRLHRDFRSGVAAGPCTFGLGSKGQVDAAFMGWLFFGFATARASYFAGDQPLPGAVVQQIQGDLPLVRAGLSAVTGCMQIAALEGRLDVYSRGLSTMPGRAAWETLTKIYGEIEEALRRSRCVQAPVTPPSPPRDLNACLKTTCAQVCAGATILLGVVSGSPECQACVQKNCR